MRDWLATTDQQFSALLDVTSPLDIGCGVPEATGPAGVVHDPVRAYFDRVHIQRVIGVTDEGDRAVI